MAAPLTGEARIVNLSTLAGGTVESRPAALNETANRTDATATWLPFAIVHRKRLGEIAKLAIGTCEVAQGRSARLDRLVDDLAYRNDQPLQSGQGNRTSRSFGMDAGSVESLADIDIAEACNNALIEQQQLDRGASACQPPLQVARIEVERLGPESGERGPFVKNLRRHQVYGPESPRVIESQPRSLVGLDQQMIVLLQLIAIDAPASRHAEVEHQGVLAIGVDQSVFRTAAEVRDGGPCQPLPKLNRKWTAQVGTAGLDVPDPPAFQDSGKSADRCFDLGKFGHGSDMADWTQAR